MQIGTISSADKMLFVNSRFTGLSLFHINQFSVNHLCGYPLYLFAEKIIKKYELLGKYGLEPAVLIFLRNLYEEAEKNEEFSSRLEETLRLLVLWNEKDDDKDKIVCHQNVYSTSLKNVIETNFSYLKEMNYPHYNQLRKLYTTERSEQNNILLKTLISELNSLISTPARSTLALRENYSTPNTVGTSTVKIHSLSNNFHTMLENVVNINYMPGNRELFYSTVRNQLIHHFLKKKDEELNSFENGRQYSTDGSLIEYQYSFDDIRWAEQIYNIIRTGREQDLSNFSMKGNNTISLYNYAFPENQFNNISDTVAGGMTIEHQALASSFHTMLDSVMNTSHMPGNMELFYSSVRNQLIHYMFAKIEDMKSLENAWQHSANSFMQNEYSRYETHLMAQLYNFATKRSLISKVINDKTSRNYRTLLTDTMSFSSLDDQDQLLEYLRNTDEREFEAISQKILELSNIHEYSTLQQLIERMTKEQNRGILQLVTSFGRLSGEELSFLEKKSFTKSELLHIVDNGTDYERFLAYKALSFAAKNIASINMVSSNLESISTLSNLLRKAESNHFDLSQEYELDGARLTLNQYISRQEHSAWSEIEKQVNRYKTVVSQQLNNISLLENLLVGNRTKDEILTVLKDGKDDHIFNTIRTAISHISDVDISQNLMSVFSEAEKALETIEHSRFISPMLQYRDQILDGFIGRNLPTDLPVQRNKKNTMNMNLMWRLRKYFNLQAQQETSFVPERHLHVYGDQNILNEDSSHEGLIYDETVVFTKPVEEFSGSLRTQRSISSYHTMGENLIGTDHLHPGDRRNTPVIDQVPYDVRNEYATGKNGIPMLRHVTNMALTWSRNLALKKSSRFIRNMEPKNMFRYLMSQNNQMARKLLMLLGDSSGNNRVDYNNFSTTNNEMDLGNHVVMEFYKTDQVQKQDPQNIALPVPAQSELINRFGNLIYDPNLPPSELIGRQSDSLLADSIPVKSLNIHELFKRITLGERLIREEQTRVVELTQKITEHEARLYKMNHAHSQLQEDVASRVDEKKIKLMVMKEIRAKMNLEKMRYGLQ